MKKKHSKKNLPIANNFSEDEMIEIQAEAYYRAFKRIKKEEGEENKSNAEINIEKYKWYENVLYFLNVFFLPWCISKKFCLNKRLYDGVLVFFVATIMLIIGTIVWGIGFIEIVYAIYQGFVLKNVKNMLSLVGLSLLMLVLGSIVIVSGNTFSEETNSERIHAYSASILALISCIISIISLLR